VTPDELQRWLARRTPDLLRVHRPLVCLLAARLFRRVSANVEFDDLVQAGMLGLLDAISRFDPDAGVVLSTFATPRIEGAMLDELRAADWMGTKTRRQRKRVDETVRSLQQDLQRSPLEAEVANAMGLALEQYQTLLTRLQRGQPVPLGPPPGDDSSPPGPAWLAADPAPQPLEALTDQRLRQALVEAIKALPDRLQLVMSLYYEHDLTLRETGAVLGVSESMACQLHSAAVASLRRKLRDWRPT
jgi:RNA polymerase sigma factor for flagellar operon FliA